jgi:hypothetical protein
VQQFVAPPHYNNVQHKYKQEPQYNTPHRDNQGNIGRFRGGGHGRRGFRGVRGLVTCHNC